MALHLKSTGIDFTDFSDVTETSELLDDYEEGYHAYASSANWAPTDAAAKLYYNKIGSTLIMNGLIVCGSVSASTSWVGSLPFTTSSDTQSSTHNPSGAGGGLMYAGVDGGESGLALYLPLGAAQFKFYQLNDNAGWLLVNNSHWAVGDEIYMSLHVHTE
jgi:hypothetical protein